MVTESKQRANYYQLAVLGKKQIDADHQRWFRLVHAVGATIEPEVQA
jgi:hypothetical protein